MSIWELVHDSLCVDAKSLQSLRPHELSSTRPLCPWDSLGKNARVSCYALLQGILPTRESNSRLLYEAGSLPLEPTGKPIVLCTFLKVYNSPK